MAILSDTTLISIVNAHCPQPQVFVDIGGFQPSAVDNWRRAFPKMRWIAVDADAERISLPINAGVETCCCAVMDKTGSGLFFKKRDPNLSSIYNYGGNAPGDAVIVPALRLDDLCAKIDVQAVDILRIDAPGAAWAILHGAGRLLYKFHVLFIESEEPSLFAPVHALHTDVCFFLAARGFTKVVERSGELPDARCISYSSVWVQTQLLDEKENDNEEVR